MISINEAIQAQGYSRRALVPVEVYEAECIPLQKGLWEYGLMMMPNPTSSAQPLAYKSLLIIGTIYSHDEGAIPIARGSQVI